MIQNIFQVLTDSYSPAIILPRSQTKIHYSSLRHSIQFLSHQKPFSDLNPGDIVSFSMPSSVEFILTFFCIASVNAVANPMVGTWNLTETVENLQIIKPVCVICVKGCSNLEILQTACNQLLIPLYACSLDLTFQKIQVPRVVRRIAIRVNTQLSNVKPIASIFSVGIESPPDSNKFGGRKESNSNLAVIVSTHSTTGASKFVPLSHQSILKNLENITRLFDLGPSDCTLLLVPLYHSHGLVGILLSTFLTGGTVVLESEFAYDNFWNDASAYNASWFSATPWMHRQILKANKASSKLLHFSFKFVQSTGSPLNDNLLLDMETAYHAQIITSYTMTEASHLIATNIPNRTRKLGSMGAPVIPCILVNENNVKISSGIGEICICGPTVFSGYLGALSHKDKFFEHNGSVYFKTGDLAWFDERGFLLFAGRRDDMIPVGDTLVSGVVLDKLLGQHPAIEDLAFFGNNRKLDVAVVLKDGAHATGDDLKLWMKSLLPTQLPENVHFVRKLPRTLLGKIRRSKLICAESKL